jgi:HK97 family phage major capsid protein
MTIEAKINSPSGVNADARGFSSSNPADKLIDLVYALKSQFRANARFVMNRRTVSAVRKPKDGDGNYLWRPVGAGESASLLGYPVTEIEDMPDIEANAYAIAFGDFRRLSDRGPAGRARVARSLLAEALCAVLDHQACGRRCAELRCHQGHEVRGLLMAGWLAVS